MFLCLLLGGVSAEDLLVTFALTLAAVLFVASLGLLISIGARRAYGAVVVTFLILLVAWLALPAVALLILFTGGTGAVSGWVSDCGLALISLNPIVALMNVVIDGGGPPGMWVDSHWVCTATYGSSALLLMLINVVVIRRFGLWASRERVVRDRKRDRRRRVRQVWSNPVAWREVRTIVIHRRMRWARILSLVFSFMFSAIVWVGWVADWWDHRPALTMDIEHVCGVIACTATVAWVLMALQGSVSFSHEREHSTLDALLTTPLAGYQIVLGKMQGILRSSAFALAFPIGFTLLTWFRHLTSLRAAVWTIAAILVVGVFAACLGLAASVRLGSSGKACGLAAGVILFLCVGLPMASSSFISYNGRHAWLPLTHVSPAENVCWSAYDEDVRGDVRYLHRYIENYRNWSGRFAISAVHVGVELLVAVVLVGWSVATVEEQWRVRQLWFPRWFRLEQVSPGLPPALVEDR
jgi:ABC-type transport system involved in multi-copper enzyme maturation permease subunit